MRERATVVGGDLAILSSGDGTEVRVRLPGNGGPA
jgi:signal transduction histidine kinase